MSSPCTAYARAVSPAPPTEDIRVSPFVLTWPRILGVSLPEMARASGVTLAKLEASDGLTYEETMQVWQGLENLMNDPVVGLHAGARFTIDQMGVVGPALAHATHLDAALDVLVRIMGIFVKNAGICRRDSEEGAAIEYRAPTLRSRHGIDTIFAATVALVRHCTEKSRKGEALVPLAVRHQMPKKSEAEYVRFFGVAPTWDEPASQLWFKRSDLALPFFGASPVLAELLAEHVPRLMSSEGQSSTFEQDFERAFWTAHQAGEATLETTAEALGVSARTLQRRLTTMSSTFADQRGAILHRRATTLLMEETLPIETIAQRLGYSSRAAFERAFLRWTGKTPHAVRASRGV